SGGVGASADAGPVAITGLSWWAADFVSAAARAREAAQAWQNFARARLNAPHDGHGIGSGAEHSSQNLAPSRLSEPQLEQRIDLIETGRLTTFVSFRREK